jgi:hypothetical protein
MTSFLFIIAILGFLIASSVGIYNSLVGLTPPSGFNEEGFGGGDEGYDREFDSP